MRHFIINSLIIFSTVFVVGCKKSTDPTLLKVLTHDSMLGEGSLGELLKKEFETQTGAKLEYLNSGDAAQMVTRLELDAKRGQASAHVVLGLDDSLWARAKPLTESWQDWKPDQWNATREFVRIDEDGFLPYDYSVFAFMADRTLLKKWNLESPERYKDLLRPEWKGRFVLEDPRTSTPGLGFLRATHSVFQGEELSNFWKSLSEQWWALSPGWSAAYGIFLKEQAALVWSYTTSEAYHRAHGDTKKRYVAVKLKDPHPIQVEGAAIVKGSLQTEAQRKWAREFLTLLLSEKIQNALPEKNWMFPVRGDVKLPESFQDVPSPTLLPTKWQEDALLNDWQKWIAK